MNHARRSLRHAAKGALLALAVACAAAAAAAAAADEEAVPEWQSLLQRIVNINSGTQNVEGLDGRACQPPRDPSRPVPIQLTNTLTKTKEVFEPIDPGNVRVYVCGPTVYDFAHIGNARPVAVFDVLFRLLRHVYGADHVTYARNITDVDDKAVKGARERRVNVAWAWRATSRCGGRCLGS